MRISDWSSDVCSSDLMARARGLENVRFVGFTDDAPAFLAGLHAYVQPSHHEGLCIAAHEAMLAALPVVGTAVGELPRSLGDGSLGDDGCRRSEEHTSELQSLMRISYAVFCLKKKKKNN